MASEGFAHTVPCGSWVCPALERGSGGFVLTSFQDLRVPAGRGISDSGQPPVVLWDFRALPS